MEFLGPIFIKFGQWASTRKDLFPQDICHTLSELQRTVSSHSWIYTKQLLKATYGPNWRKIFVKFEDQVPLGSGCCAQVRVYISVHLYAYTSTRIRLAGVQSMGGSERSSGSNAKAPNIYVCSK